MPRIPRNGTPCASGAAGAAAVSLSVASKAGFDVDAIFRLLIRAFFSQGQAAWKKLPVYSSERSGALQGWQPKTSPPFGMHGNAWPLLLSELDPSPPTTSCGRRLRLISLILGAFLHRQIGLPR